MSEEYSGYNEVNHDRDQNRNHQDERSHIYPKSGNSSGSNNNGSSNNYAGGHMGNTRNNYSGNSNGNNWGSNKGGGSGNNWNGKKQWNGGGNNFKRKDEDIDPATVKIYLPYVATGNRNPPEHIVEKMIDIAKDLESHGYILRTGGLDGPDDALFRVIPSRELYLPWKGFSDKDSKLYFNTKETSILASKYHPAFDTLKPAIQAFLGMNTRMVMGKDLRSAAMFALVWSEDGAELDRDRTSKTGNIGHVLAIANARRMPVFNIQREDAKDRLYRFLDI